MHNKCGKPKPRPRPLLAVLIFFTTVLSTFATPMAVYHNDTTHVHSFRADSVRFGNATYLTSSSGNMLIVMANDTASAGYSSDSIKFNFGVQYGTVVPNSSGKRHPKDTTWGPLIRYGTFSTLAADTAGKWVDNGVTFSADSMTGQPPVMMGVMDSTYVTGYACLRCPVTTIQPEHLVRPWAIGTTGNKTGSFVKLILQFVQLEWLPVRD